jgi:dethiobiotin synthetase
LLIEGAGGVMAPLTGTETCLDLIEALRAPVLFVGGTYLGAVSHALTGLEALRARGVSVAALIVSESDPSAGLGATQAMLGAMRPDLTIAAAPRDGEDAWAVSLAALLRRE